MFVIMGNTYDIKRGEWRPDAHTLLSAQETWFAVFMTVLYVVPCLLCLGTVTHDAQCVHPLGDPSRSPCRG